MSTVVLFIGRSICRSTVLVLYSTVQYEYNNTKNLWYGAIKAYVHSMVLLVRTIIPTHNEKKWNLNFSTYVECTSRQKHFSFWIILPICLLFSCFYHKIIIIPLWINQHFNKSLTYNEQMITKTMPTTKTMMINKLRL